MPPPVSGTGYEVVAQIPSGIAPWTFSAPTGKFIVSWPSGGDPADPQPFDYVRDVEGRITGLICNSAGTEPVFIICVNG